MSNLPIGLQRLLQLAEHLEKGELGHKKFDFSIFNNSRYSVCGTAGCALGECPIVWPLEWEFDTTGDPCLTGTPLAPGGSAVEWFGADLQEVSHLFFSRYQQPEKFGGVPLPFDATKEQVASNIRAFVDIKAKALQTDAA